MTKSIKDVAETAGVSTATVSHVINGTRFVSEETRAKVLKAMNQLNYHPNLVARSLRSQKSNIIGLLLPNISNFYFTSIALGIENVLRKNGYNLILSNSNENLENEKEQVKVFNAQLIDGMIIASTAGEHSYLYKDLTCNYPVVFIDRKPKNYKADYVVLDNVKSTYDAISILIEKGHKRVGIITGFNRSSTTEERIKGYKKAFADHGMDIDDSLIRMGDFTFESGYQIASELVEHSKASALFVVNSIMTIGSLIYLNEKGIKIPEQIAIVGCDDHKWSRVTNPPLSVVAQPAYELGETAASLLLQRISQPDMDYKEYRLASKIILRNSC